MRRTGSAKVSLRTAAKEINLDGAKKQCALSISLRARHVFGRQRIRIAFEKTSLRIRNGQVGLGEFAKECFTPLFEPVLGRILVKEFNYSSMNPCECFEFRRLQRGEKRHLSLKKCLPNENNPLVCFVFLRLVSGHREKSIGTEKVERNKGK